MVLIAQIALGVIIAAAEPTGTLTLACKGTVKHGIPSPRTDLYPGKQSNPERGCVPRSSRSKQFGKIASEPVYATFKEDPNLFL